MYPTIVPFRHPMSIAESWKKRGKPLSNLAVQYQIFREAVACNNPFYLPLDAPNREEYLDQIRKRIGMPIETSWPVIGSENSTATLTRVEEDQVRHMMSDGFFGQFGYEYQGDMYET